MTTPHSSLPARHSDNLEEIISEYPLYLRWGQLVELHRRLGLGARKVVEQRIAAGEIEKVQVYGKRAHYTRSSVVARGNVED